MRVFFLVPKKCVALSESDTGPSLLTLLLFSPSRHGPVEPLEYLTRLCVTYKERDLPYYQGGQPTVHPSKGSYAHPQDGPRATELWYPQYYTSQAVAQHKGPLRQDVPPSPPQGHRVLPYHEMGRPGLRRINPDQYQYRHQDPRQKDSMTAAV